MMLCPHCYQRAMPLARFILLNPFKPFQCDCCGVTLKTAALIRFLCIASICAGLGTCIYTFPLMYHTVHSQSNTFARLLLDLFLPYIVIPVQIAVMFIPAAVYTWKWGRLEFPATS
jgi:hypothetical protein